MLNRSCNITSHKPTTAATDQWCTKWLLHDMPTNQLAVSQFVDQTTHSLDDSQTSQFAEFKFLNITFTAH